MRIDEVVGAMQVPGNPHGFISAATAAESLACLLPMRQLIGGQRIAALLGRGCWRQTVVLPSDFLFLHLAVGAPIYSQATPYRTQAHV